MFSRTFITLIALPLSSVGACGRLAADGIRIEHDPGGTVADTLDKPTTYGLKVSAPWPDGGWVMINLPEHLTYRPSDQAILRWGDNRREGAALNPWKISEDGREAAMDVESPHTRGIRVVGKVKAVGDDRISLAMKIVNGRDFKLDAVRALYCTHYRMLAGFPSWEEGLPWCYVLVDGHWAKLSELPTANAKTVVKWAKVKGRDIAPKEFVTSRGGASEKDLDAAVAVVTAKDGKRKLAIGWKPAGSMLANAGIPCLHADPWYDDIPPGESREAEGLMVFTEKSLDDILAEFRKLGFVEGPERK
jgi:hypothetical protein